LRRSRLAAWQQTREKIHRAEMRRVERQPVQALQPRQKQPGGLNRVTLQPNIAPIAPNSRAALAAPGTRVRSPTSCAQAGSARSCLDGRKREIGSMDRLCAVMSTVLLTRGFISLAKIKSADRLPIKIALAMAP
jgi:hypothetical protein